MKNNKYRKYSYSNENYKYAIDSMCEEYYAATIEKNNKETNNVSTNIDILDYPLPYIGQKKLKLF